MTPADLIDEAAAAGVTLGLSLKVTAKRKPDADLLAHLERERAALVGHLVLTHKNALPCRPELVGVTNAMHAAEVSHWLNGRPRPDAGQRLLSLLKESWPPDVVDDLALRHARDRLRMTGEDAFTCLFRNAVEVTRQDRGAPG